MASNCGCGCEDVLGLLAGARGIRPRGAPHRRSVRGTRSAALDNEDYLDFADDDDLSFRRKRWMFDRRPFIGQRCRYRVSVEKRLRRLVGSSSPEYLLRCEECGFGDWEDVSETEMED